MRLRTSRALLGALVVILFVAMGPLQARAGSDADWKAVADVIGRTGDLKAGVYRVSFPRIDLKVTVDGIPIKTGLALGGWAAFTRAESTTVVDGDFALRPEEINPAVTALLANGLEVTALHNHLVLETPHVMYLHFFGTGDAVALARGVRAAITETAIPPADTSPAAPAQSAPEWARAVEQSFGRSGTV